MMTQYESQYAPAPHTRITGPEGDVGGWFWPVWAIIVATASWIAFRLYVDIRLEDALITYRYAENLALGHGFVFNIGERVLGTTTPLYTLLLAGGGLLFGVQHIPLISNILGITSATLALWCVMLILRRCRIGSTWSAVTLLFMGLHPTMLWTTAGGMETPLVLCLMTASLLAVLRRRWMGAMVLVALLALARPDGLVWTGLIALIVLVQAGRRAIAPLVVFAIVVGGWTAFAQIYFGSPVPNSVYAKQALELGYAANMHWRDMLRANLHWDLVHLWLPHTYGWSMHQVWGWLVFLAFGVLGILRRGTHLCPLLILPVFLVGLCAAYHVGSAPRFPWYGMPLTWCSLFLGMIGLWELWVIFSLYWKSFDLRRWTLGALVGLVLLVLVVPFAHRIWNVTRQEREIQRNEDALRRVAGEWLRVHASPDDVIATEAIGYQGYYSGRRLLDFAGLISPEVVDIMRCSSSHAETFGRILEECKPRFIVLRAFEVRDNAHFHGGPLFETPEQRAYFEKHYSRAWESPPAPYPDAVNWQLLINGEWKTLAELVIYQRLETATP